MLAMSRKVGTYLKVGDALIQIVAVRGVGRQARIAIFAPPHVRVQRFDEEGNPESVGVRVVDVQTHQSAPEFVRPGRMKATLACGHVLCRPATVRLEVHEKIGCQECNDAAAKVTAEIRAAREKFPNLLRENA